MSPPLLLEILFFLLFLSLCDGNEAPHARFCSSGFFSQSVDTSQLALWFVFLTVSLRFHRKIFHSTVLNSGLTTWVLRPLMPPSDALFTLFPPPPDTLFLLLLNFLYVVISF